MSTKNIALNIRVYERLARFKRESESFSRAPQAAWALEHGARLATRNRKHFEKVSGLQLISY